MSRLRISVIVPFFQEAARIGDLVRYLRLHGGEALVEVIVVDSGSTDCTASYAVQAGARVLQSPVRSRAAQMNVGAGAASGEILYFVHAAFSALHRSKVCHRIGPEIREKQLAAGADI